MAEKVKKAKASYTMWQNSLYMIKTAWHLEKSVIFMGVLEAVIGLGLVLVNLLITPSILNAVESGAPLGQLFGIMGGFAGLLVVFHAMQQYVNGITVYPKVTVRTVIIGRLIAKLTRTSYPNLHEKQFKVLEEKAEEAVESNAAATEGIWATLTKLLQNIMGFVIYMLLLSDLNAFLIGVVLLTAVLGYFANHAVNQYGYRHREEMASQRKQIGYIKSTAHDITGAKDIRIFGLSTWLLEVEGKARKAYDAFQKKVAGVYLLGNMADLILAFLRNGVAYAYLIHLALQRNLSAAEFLLYFTAIEGFSTWISGILESINKLHQQSLDICHVREFTDYPEPFQFEAGERLEAKPGQAYEICLRDVSFRYPGAEKDTLSHINLSLRSGEKLAVVGLNGAGKTTLIKILCGFLDPSEGKVMLNGRDIRNYNRRDYYQMFSAVFQTFSLLAGSIAVNVAQSEKEINEERVRECIAKAGLSEKIESLPDQYETLLERSVYQEAVMLSGGEMQRLMLARALYKDAPVIVLDEPTAALDPLAEEDIYRKYQSMTEGKSSVYISHRLASTRFCDRIILIQDGIIKEEGTHAELLAQGGVYAELFNIQSEYYR